MKFLFYIVVFTLFLQNVTFSQTADLTDDITDNVTVPFVSNINTVYSSGSILLTWTLPENFNDYVTIYRHNAPITNENTLAKSIKIVVIKNSSTEYIDKPPYGKFYYAILLTDKKTLRDRLIFAPYRNITNNPTYIEKESNFVITSIKTESDNAVNILWNYYSDSTGDRNIYIYRNSEPIVNEKILNKSVNIVKTNIKNKIYRDTVVPGVNYYYAIINENTNKKELKADVNFTTKGASIPERVNYITNFSSEAFTPLPLLNIQTDPITSGYFKDKQILQSPFKKKIDDNLLKIIDKNLSLFDSVVDNVDLASKLKGKHLDVEMLEDENIFKPMEYEDAYNKIIIDFKSNNYQNVTTVCDTIISDNISDETRSRLSYYAGLSYYKLGMNYNAYIYLMLSVDRYRSQTIKYLESIHTLIFNNLER